LEEEEISSTIYWLGLLRIHFLFFLKKTFFFFVYKVKFPWPLTNRDYVFQIKTKYFEEKQTFVYLSKGTTHSSKPETTSAVRVTTYTCALVFRTDKNGNVEFRMQ
jgi:hypothetical protein